MRKRKQAGSGAASPGCPLGLDVERDEVREYPEGEGVDTSSWNEPGQDDVD
jgi:hypothetical protein